MCVDLEKWAMRSEVVRRNWTRYKKMAAEDSRASREKELKHVLQEYSGVYAEDYRNLEWNLSSHCYSYCSACATTIRQPFSKDAITQKHVVPFG